jgi:hypothetical protein
VASGLTPSPVSHLSVPVSEDSNAVLYIVITMLVCLVVASLVVVYVAYPHRGEKMPAVPWFGDALGKAADAAPVISEDEADLLHSRSQ